MYSLSTEQEHQIRELIARNQKIAAIKLYRESTGSSLKDAKEIVEAMQMGAADYFPEPTQAGAPETSLDNRIRNLLAERKKVEAVKVYRDAHNCGLKEAKDAVDAIETQMRRGNYTNISSTPTISNDPFAEDSQRNRRFLSFLITIVLLVIGGVVFFLLAGNGF